LKDYSVEVILNRSDCGPWVNRLRSKSDIFIRNKSDICGINWNHSNIFGGLEKWDSEEGLVHSPTLTHPHSFSPSFTLTHSLSSIHSILL
jgi:hypothetical protein